jgi:hypothetical protein
MGIREYLDTAIRTGKSVTIEYIKYEGEKSFRTISNIQYSDEYGDDYIQAFCHNRQENRTFKISRIKSVDDITNAPAQSGSVVKKHKSAYSGNSTTENNYSAVKPIQSSVSSTDKPSHSSASSYSSPSYNSSYSSPSYNKSSYTPTSKQKMNEGCYVATMAYGDYNHPQVLTLRRFRDDVLLKSIFGRLFVKIYYYVSPKLVRLLRDSETVNTFIRKILDRFCLVLNQKEK